MRAPHCLCASASFLIPESWNSGTRRDGCYNTIYIYIYIYIYDMKPEQCHRDKTKTPWPLVREQTIPTERPPLVNEI
jgi:hypothetical protein